MKSNSKLIRKSRIYSEEFKRSLVESFEKGEFSVAQLERLHGVANPTIYKWIYKFSTINEKGQRIVEMKDSNTKKLKELEEKIKSLERAVGQKQIKIDFLEKLVDIAEEEYEIDIKKNSSTKPLTGSEKITKK